MHMLCDRAHLRTFSRRSGAGAHPVRISSSAAHARSLHPRPDGMLGRMTACGLPFSVRMHSRPHLHFWARYKATKPRFTPLAIRDGWRPAGCCIVHHRRPVTEVRVQPGAWSTMGECFTEQLAQAHRARVGSSRIGVSGVCLRVQHPSAPSTPSTQPDHSPGGARRPS